MVNNLPCNCWESISHYTYQLSHMGFGLGFELLALEVGMYVLPTETNGLRSVTVTIESEFVITTTFGPCENF